MEEDTVGDAAELEQERELEQKPQELEIEQVDVEVSTQLLSSHV